MINGRYSLVRGLGRGGVGAVFLVKDEHQGGALLALKRISESADDSVVRALRREFQALAAIRHPRIAVVHDFGRIREGDEMPPGAFFTRDYVEGDPLVEASRGRDLAAIVEILVDLCHALVPLHRSGLVHGDLKPDNVLVDRAGRVRLIDFGLLRRETETVDGGTLAYLAPEALRGGGADVRADLYGLGATMAHVLFGSPRFEASSKPAVAGAEALRPIVARLMSADPAARFPDAEEVAASLARAVPSARPAPAEPWAVVLPRVSGEEELARLEAAYEDRLMRRSGGDPLVVLVGDAGSGRTTLLREFKWRAQLRGAQVLEAPRGASGPFGPMAAILRQAAALAASDAAKLAALRALELVEGNAEADAAVIAEAVGRAVLFIARQGPLVVVVDDVDEIPAAAAGLLRWAAHSVNADDPLLVVATASDPERPAVRELGTALHISVRALETSAVESMLAATTGRRDPDLAAAIRSRTAGNLLFTAEVLRLVLAGKVATPADLERQELPARLEDLEIARLRSVGPEDLRMLATAAAFGTPVPESWLVAASGAEPARVASLLAEGRLLRSADGSLGLARPAVARALLAQIGDTERQARELAVAGVLEREGAPASVRAIHLARAGDAAGVRALAPGAARALRKVGAARGAAELLEALAAFGEGDQKDEATVDLADVLHGLGEYAAARGRLEALIVRARGAVRLRALVLLGRACSALSDDAAAERALADVLADEPDASTRAGALRDLARMRIRRGDYAAAEKAAVAGLAAAGPDDPVRIELLLARGLVSSYAGDADAARARYEEALALARRAGDKRDEAGALQYLAILHHRAGDYARATERYRESLELARETGDVGSMATFHGNLGAVSFLSGDPARAREHYELAVRLARRVGRTHSAVQATNNLAHLHAYLGMFERARREADEAFMAAQRLGLASAAAHARAVSGEVAAREGRIEEALSLQVDASSRYEALGQHREAADVWLDEAETLLDRGRPADIERAQSLVDASTRVADAEKLADFRPRLLLVRARVLSARGSEEEALAALETALGEARTSRQGDVEWQVHGLAADLYAVRGASLLARRRREVAVEMLEGIASTLPREFRHSFWQVARRRDIQRRLEASAPAAPSGRSGPGDEAQKLLRLAEVNKKIIGELDGGRLFEAILDAAVELTGAERGFLLLADPGGSLQATTARQFGGGAPSPEHAKFSRSIAESVFVDGEPVITVSAKNDDRWNEYLSVHQLQLQSVLCIPIRARSRVLGVLYMENRFRPGRFDEGDERILSAFGDQVAIALENARLHKEVLDRQRELERANAEIEGAKDEIERLLVQRTSERDELRAQLGRARAELGERFGWRGIIGSSESMRKVFALLDRVRETDVPVVIQGESGTGKELVARALQQGGSRAQKPFVAVNCAAIPDTLLESELFGHVRGSFTGADRDKRGLFVTADGGTLFLDEIGDMPVRMQTDLLRVLQEQKVRPIGGDTDVPVDVRVVAACSKPLRELVAAGRFREDLYYRMAVVEVTLPPLRERAGDIPLLVDHFLRAHATRLDSPRKSLSRGAVRRLCAYSWPGNVRQLEHALLSAWVLSDDAIMGESDLRLEPAVREERSTAAAAAPTGDRRDEEKKRIIDSLEQTNWNRSKAAEVLGMPRRTFYRRLKDYGIQ